MRSQSARLTTLLAGAALLAGGLGWSFTSRAQAAQARRSKAELTAGYTRGKMDFKAIGPLAFSQNGILFFADDQAGVIYGVDLDEKPSQAAAYTKVPDLGATLAGKMGTTPAGIQIKDIAVSPVSRAVYLSVRKTDGADQNPANPANYALFSVDPTGKVSAVDLSNCLHGKASVAGQPRFGRRNTMDSRVIGDIAYGRGRVFVSALSTEQFSSNLVSVPVPFKAEGTERYATSIYHISHKKQETASPIQTLTVYRDGEKQYLMAAYVCTPVVRFNLEDLKPGQTVTGATVAELGSGNQPMRMIAYGRAGEQSLLVDNSSFGVLKVGANIAKESAAVNEMSKADRGNGGKTPVAGIEEVAALKGAKAYAASGDSLLVVKPTEGGMSLEAMPLP